MAAKIYHPHLSNISPLVHLPDDCTVHSHVWIGDTVVIGHRVSIQAFCYLPNGVLLEDDVFLGPRVTFLNDKYPPSSVWSATVVKRGASIGGGATILPGVTIGAGARIGAGSVVTKDVPEGETWCGNPARPLRK